MRHERLDRMARITLSNQQVSVPVRLVFMAFRDGASVLEKTVETNITLVVKKAEDFQISGSLGGSGSTQFKTQTATA